ncbi:MAG: LysE family translocator [Pseudomonadota bacterium]
MNIEFLVTALIVCILPGTGVIYTLAVGLGRGFVPSTIAALGCTLGIVPHALVSIIGLAALLQTSTIAFQTVQWLGVAYLFYMAWGILRDESALTVSEQNDPIGAYVLIRDGILLNALNPKLSLFFLAFLPQFVPPSTLHPATTMMALAFVFMVMTFAVFVFYGACASSARDYVISKPAVMRWLKRSFAAAFILLGVRLALAGQ